MKRVIVIGANSKSTDKQNLAAFEIGKVLAENNYLCIHGGGCGVMLNTTLGMQSVNLSKGNSLTYVIWPNSMKKETEETNYHYKNIYKYLTVDTIHDRIGVLIKESSKCEYIICYGGGLGTANELFSIIVNYYDKTENMPSILFCNEDANDLIKILNNLFLLWNVPNRPYIQKIIDKILILNKYEIQQILKNKSSNI